MSYLTAPEELTAILGDEPPYRASQLREWLYEHPVLDAESMTNLPATLRQRIGHDLWPFDVEVAQSADRGATHKWLFRAPDGASIEAIVMGYPKRTTLCISSQAGCAMGCTFCATGQFGFERHLTAGEIIAQVAYAKAWVAANGLTGAPQRVSNVVFMGMGEPLANYRNVREALRRMIETMGMSARSVTVSTVGVVPGMRRLADEPWPVNLAVSLHAADDETRSRLVPLNKRYPLAEVVDAARYFFEQTGRRISIEWALIADVNDSRDQAARLADIAGDLRAHINVIELNATPLSPDRPPTPSRVRAFLGELEARGANVTKRDTRGSDIDGACGQLRVRAAGATPLPFPGLPKQPMEDQ